MMIDDRACHERPGDVKAVWIGTSFVQASISEVLLLLDNIWFAGFCLSNPCMNSIEIAVK